MPIAFIVQSFYRAGKQLVADQPRKMKDEKAAIDGAWRLIRLASWPIRSSTTCRPT